MRVNIDLDTDNASDLKALLALASSFSPGSKTPEGTPGPNARGLVPSMANGDPASLDTVGPEPEPEEPPAPEPVKRTRRTKAEMEAARAAEAKAEPESAPEEDDTSEDANLLGDDDEDVLGVKAQAYTLDKVVEIAGTYLNDGRRPEVAALLKKYDATKVTTLPEDKYAAFVADLKALPPKA